MTERVEAKGNSSAGYKWDDGFDHDDVTNIYIRGGIRGIGYFFADYVKSGQLKEGQTQGLVNYGYSIMFGINHLENEHLESVDVFYKEKSCIQALQFKTNFKTSELMGNSEECIKFTLAVQGKKIIGFHGSSVGELFSLGAYFTWTTPTKLEVKGGKGGNMWDDGYDHDNISKIEVRGGSEGIQYIKFDYVKNGQLKNGSLHGVSRRGGFRQTFEIDHLNKEYLISVEGYYDDASGVIQGLEFQTNIKNELMGYDKGSKFALVSNGNKIIGFHGFAEKSLNSIGAYISTTTANKLELLGYPAGFFWDDGSNHDGIRAVYIDSQINNIGFEYVHKGKAENTHRMARSKGPKAEFLLDYPNEFLTSVEGMMVFDGNFSLIKSLTLKTSKGRTSPTYGEGRAGYRKFVLEKNGNALVGFYGWSDYNSIRALGAYYRPLPPPPDAEKLVAQGGDRGEFWDDGGTFYGIRKIYIGVSNNAVSIIKFMYFKSTQTIFGDDHGNKTVLSDVQEFQLNWPLESITSVEGCYDDKSGVITMLRFKTDRRTSPDYGVATTTTFVLEKTDHQIVGFHGKSSNMLHKLGVHVLPNNYQFKP